MKTIGERLAWCRHDRAPSDLREQWHPVETERGRCDSTRAIFDLQQQWRHTGFAVGWGNEGHDGCRVVDPHNTPHQTAAIPFCTGIDRPQCTAVDAVFERRTVKADGARVEQRSWLQARTERRHRGGNDTADGVVDTIDPKADVLRRKRTTERTTLPEPRARIAARPGDRWRDAVADDQRDARNRRRVVRRLLDSRAGYGNIARERDRHSRASTTNPVGARIGSG